MPVFASDDEKKDFVQKVRKEGFVYPVNKSEFPVPDRLENGEDGRVYGMQIHNAIAMVDMLERFRG